MSNHAATREDQINGVRSVVVENDLLRVSILPELGGKIYELTWKPSNREFLWHTPRIPPQPYPVEAAIGNFWCGGWDDIFPTCDACEFGGSRYPGLGELHLVQFSVDNVRVEGEQAIALLSAYTPISPIKAEKILTLSGPVLRIHHEILNLAPLPVDFIWGTHPAFRPTAQMILRIPAAKGIVVQSSGTQFGNPGQKYMWPMLKTSTGEVTDMSRVRGIDAKGFCGHYAMELDDGWYALEDTETGDGIIITFPLHLCPYVWMWLSYGGWRGHWVIIIEPYTSYPVNLAEAVRRKTHRRIEANEKFTVDITVSFYRKPETLAEALDRLK